MHWACQRNRSSSAWKRLRATREALFAWLRERGYQVCLLHPAQAHQFAQRREMRAKTDKLDAVTIEHVLLSGEARIGYVPDELIATYRELVRLHTHLSAEVARYKNEIHALVAVLFPEFREVFANPCLPTALAVLSHYPSAVHLAQASEEELTAVLRSEVAPFSWSAQRWRLSELSLFQTVSDAFTGQQKTVNVIRATRVRSDAKVWWASCFSSDPPISSMDGVRSNAISR